MKIGIVGHEAAKFTPTTKHSAIEIIEGLLSHCDTVVSGACHLGGIDEWAEQVAETIGAAKLIFPPKTRAWESGYKPRNMRIAEESEVVHCIVVAKLPASYTGDRYEYCYHCKTDAHVKSGGCWTAKYAQRLGKPAHWHVVVERA